jgi:putative transposase
MMKRSRFTEAEMMYAVKQTRAGVPVQEIARKYGVSNKTIYSWRSKLKSLSMSEIVRLKQLEQENTKLRKIVAELSLDNAILQDVLRKKG